MDKINLDRFERTIFFASPDGCWYWTGAKGNHGYGQFALNKKTFLPHRLAYQIYVGKIPKSLHVLHSCDNRICVNPDHLFLGTPLDNMRDKIKKGRDRYNTKLSFEQVQEIIKMVSDGVKQRDVAKKFNTCFQNISMIVNGKNRVRE
jgi:hypothetical protein